MDIHNIVALWTVIQTKHFNQNIKYSDSSNPGFEIDVIGSGGWAGKGRIHGVTSLSAVVYLIFWSQAMIGKTLEMHEPHISWLISLPTQDLLLQDSIRLSSSRPLILYQSLHSPLITFTSTFSPSIASLPFHRLVTHRITLLLIKL